ncbi:MAG: LacI family DNA-binding transcriptional regulator [Kineosporiaceae bacterium]|jgi:LacI family transcriptional regulator
MADPPRGSEPASPRERRRLTLQDIADAAGVSTGLVSLVLRGRSGPSAATAARVTEVADRLGYRANRTASQLASRRTQLLGVTMTPGNPYHGELVEEILTRTRERHFEVLLAPVTRSHEELGSIQSLVDSRCEVILLLNSTLTPDDLDKALDGLPAVCVGRDVDLPDVDVVTSGDAPAMRLLVDHLVSLGHTRIAHVDGGGPYLPQERREGFEAAMSAHGLRPLVIPGGETEEGGAEAADELLRHEGVTAAVAYNDLAAIGLMDRLYSRGVQVPDDISVTGFDDDRIAGLHGINLTTIDPSKLEQARRAVDWALERVEGGRTDRLTYAFTPRLVVRGSTAAPRSHQARPASTRG